jgi:hypothetical protein
LEVAPPPPEQAAINSAVAIPRTADERSFINELLLLCVGRGISHRTPTLVAHRSDALDWRQGGGAHLAVQKPAYSAHAACDTAPGDSAACPLGCAALE